MTCPVNFEMVVFYLEILLPAYRFSIGLQRTNSNIGEVIPSLLYMFNIWNTLSSNLKYKTVCLKLIECFQTKFEFELNSEINEIYEYFNFFI